MTGKVDEVIEMRIMIQKVYAIQQTLTEHQLYAGLDSSGTRDPNLLTG